MLAAPLGNLFRCFDEALRQQGRALERLGFGPQMQHVGVLVGANAHALIWPEITGWIHSRNRARSPPWCASF
jgi:hypothetical protein